MNPTLTTPSGPNSEQAATHVAPFPTPRQRKQVLLSLAVVLSIGWAIGMMIPSSVGNGIHILLGTAFILLVVGLVEGRLRST